jgi:hypothetical protein
VASLQAQWRCRARPGVRSMTVPPESIQVGKCYLSNNGMVRRVVRLMPDGRVQYETRSGPLRNAKTWKPGMLQIRDFASSAQREVPCNWAPEGDG